MKIGIEKKSPSEGIPNPPLDIGSGTGSVCVQGLKGVMGSKSFNHTETAPSPKPEHGPASQPVPPVDSRLKIHIGPTRRTPDKPPVVTNKSEKSPVEIFKRSPRLQSPLPADVVELQAPHDLGEQPKVNWLTMLLPTAVTIGVSVTVALVTGNMMMLLYTLPMTLSGVVLSLLNYRNQKKEFALQETRMNDSYTAELQSCRSRLEKLTAKQLQAMTDNDPSVHDCVAIAAERSQKLWNRIPDNRDFGNFRVGSGPVPFSGRVQAPSLPATQSSSVLSLSTMPARLCQEFSTVPGAPVTCDLHLDRICGIAGPHGAVKALVKNIVVQLAAHHCYSELKLAMICDPADRADLAWMQDLPHLSGDSQLHSWLCSSQMETDTLLEQVNDILKKREASLSDASYGHKKVFLPEYVFLFLQPDFLKKSEPINKFLFHPNDLGVAVIMTADSLGHLPKECVSIIEVSASEGKIYKKSNKDAVQKFQPDPSDNYTDFGQSLRNLRCAESIVAATIPTIYTFWDMYGVHSAEEIDLDRYWHKTDTRKSLAVPIGAVEKGKLFSFDIQDKKHGPHGLIAGQTGYGKTELLQSYILSTAVSFHPHDVCFFIIDYKSSFPNYFKGLPHVLGLVKDIDGGNADRPLLSLTAELQRRKRIFDRLNIKKLQDYTELLKAGKVTEAIPYIVIIVDEFSELKADRPDFIKDIIQVSRTGLSLGFRLILASQNITNAIDDDIKANSRFRICMSVNEHTESSNMLGTYDAVSIREKGRAYLKVGDNEVYRLFQSAYGGPQGEQSPEQTQCYRTIAHIQQYCKEENIQALPQLCMPALPFSMSYQPDPRKPDPAEITARVGLYDAPEVRAQPPIDIPITGSNSLIIGSSQTGKSNLLQTIIRTLAQRYSPADLNIYILDCNSGFLKFYEGLPHLGGAASIIEKDKIDNLFKLLQEEIVLRSQRFLEAGVTSFRSYREAGHRDIPQILFLLDDFTKFKDSCIGDSDFLLPIMLNGVSCGISTVITNTKPISMSNYDTVISSRLSFFCNNKSCYTDLFSYTNRALPNKPGRCFIQQGGHLHEGQVYLTFDGEQEYQRTLQVKRFVAAIKKQYPNQKAKRIPGIPDSITVSDIYQEEHALPPDRGFSVGMSYEELSVVSLDIESQFLLALLFKDEERKNSILRTMLEDVSANLTERPAEVYFVDSISRTFQDYKTLPFVKAYGADSDTMMDILSHIYSQLQQREALVMDACGNASEVLAECPVLIAVFNNRKVMDFVSKSESYCEMFEDISKNYRTYKVLFLFSDLLDKPPVYGENILKIVCKEQKALLDKLKQDALLGIGFNQIKYAPELSQKSDVYYLNEGNLERIKLVRGENNEQFL